jgi:hypothetical protein
MRFDEKQYQKRQLLDYSFDNNYVLQSDLNMGVYEVFMFVALGTLLGLLGQILRVIVGIKKEIEQTTINGKTLRDSFDSIRLVISLMIGGLAGGLGAITLLGTELNRELLLTLVAIGYSGADFIEGFVRKRTPS